MARADLFVGNWVGLGLLAGCQVGPGLVAGLRIGPNLAAERQVGPDQATGCWFSPGPVVGHLVGLLLTSFTHGAATIDCHQTLWRLAAPQPSWVRNATRTRDVWGGGRCFPVNLPKGLVDLGDYWPQGIDLGKMPKIA